MTRILPVERDVCPGSKQQRSQALRLVGRNHLVVLAREYQHRDAAEIRRMRQLQRNHSPQQDGARESSRAEQEHRGCDVGAIGVSDRDDLTEVMAVGLIFDEIGQLMRAANEIRLVENSRGKSSEETELPVFINFTARTEQRRAGAKESPERYEVVLIPAGSVQQ